MSYKEQNSVDMEFVPYEEALGLKELGFDEPCFGACYYEFKDKGITHILLSTPDDMDSRDGVKAPTYQQAFRWFRKTHKLEPEILSDMMGYVCSIVDRNKPLKTRLTPSNLFQIYEEAELACLRKLIEIVKEKQNEQQ